MLIDKELIERVKEKDLPACEELISILQQPIFVYCFRMLGNIQEAEDVTQEVFIRVFEKLCTYKKEISFSAWVYRIAHNMCINNLRRKKILKLIPLQNIEEKELYLGGVDSIFDFEISEELKDALAILSPENRSILILKIVHENTYGEIAAILGMNEALIRKRYERSRKKIETHYKKRGERTISERVTIF